MRALELASLLIPAALAIAWLCGLRGLSPRGMLALLLLLVTFAATMVWLSEVRGFTGPYTPARLQNGTVTAPHIQ